MIHFAKSIFALLIPSAMALYLGGCTCGFDCSSSDGNNSESDGVAVFSLGLSDSLPEDLSEVALKIESITLERTDGENVVIDTFTIAGSQVTDEEFIRINLLDYRGTTSLTVIDGRELEPGFYSSIVINIADDDVNESYVQETNGERKEITVAGDALRLSGVQLIAGVHRYVIEFGLAQALKYLANSDTYQLSEEGVRLVNMDTAAELFGALDSSLFNSVSPCSEKSEPTSGNRLYLYEGLNLPVEKLGDVYPEAAGVPEGTLAPFAVALLAKSLRNDWEYTFGYVPEGSYTIAFACVASEDDPTTFDNLQIPNPEDQVYEITLSKGEEGECDITTEPETGC